jgi:deazaflavin-dependent oxidoreductase (nitroreductase family)
MSTSMNDFNAKVIDEFRANEGRVGDMFEDSTLLLLNHTGARSAKEYVTPLVYMPDGDRYVIFASKAGAPTNPDWYHNLKANPHVKIEVGAQKLDVLAEEAGGEERERLFKAQTESAPQFAEYAAKTDRLIPVIVLTPAA